MQYRPDAKEILSTIQDLLMKEILPKLEDDELLSYKTLVSWNMLGVISREFEKDEDLFLAEFESLQSINNLKNDKELSTEDFKSLPKIVKIQKLRDLNQKLVETIRKDKVPDINSKIWLHVKQTLKNNLSISNPRFNT
jgi:hypothetical protein